MASQGLPWLVWCVLVVGLLALAVRGARELRVIREAYLSLDFERLASPGDWLAARLLLAVLVALPVLTIARELGVAAGVMALMVAALAFALMPVFLRGARRRLEQQLLDELALHLDLLAVALESGVSWSAALALCMERAPEGPLRRAWGPVLTDMRRGVEPLDALRGLEQRLRLQPLTTLVSALRAAEKLQRPAADVLRDRARHCAAARFARAERRARAAPLKLWAAMLLCLAPGTAVLLAYPLARLLASLAG